MERKVQRSDMMNAIEYRQTQFKAEPLRNVVGFGNVTAYQICVRRGPAIGTFGTLEEFVNDSPANASRYEDRNPEPASVAQTRSWFRRVLCS